MENLTQDEDLVIVRVFVGIEARASHVRGWRFHPEPHPKLRVGKDFEIS